LPDRSSLDCQSAEGNKKGVVKNIDRSPPPPSSFCSLFPIQHSHWSGSSSRFRVLGGGALLSGGPGGGGGGKPKEREVGNGPLWHERRCPQRPPRHPAPLAAPLPPPPPSVSTQRALSIGGQMRS
jgi:hypothetical protein